MGQITITINDHDQKALEDQARRDGVTLDVAVERAIHAARIDRVREIRRQLDDGQVEWDDVACDMDDDDILEWAVQEVRVVRNEMYEERKRQAANSNH